MKNLAQAAEMIPLWIGKDKESPPPLVGTNPKAAGYIAASGDMVAAYVKNEGNERNDPNEVGDHHWILAEVISYSESSGRYEVDDIDEDEKKKHRIGKGKVIPLPKMRLCPETNPESLFKPGTKVLAVYPQTTCLYNGIIEKQPATNTDEYQILFEDSSYEEGHSPPLRAI